MDMSAIPRVWERTENCPECWRQCWWCAANLLMMREIGCCHGAPRKPPCARGEAEKGKKCSTCNGSGKVRVRHEILGAA